VAAVALELHCRMCSNKAKRGLKASKVDLSMLLIVTKYIISQIHTEWSADFSLIVELCPRSWPDFVLVDIEAAGTRARAAG